MRRALLLTWRLQRAEIVAVAIVAIVLGGAALLISRELDALAAECMAAAEVVAPCGSLWDGGFVYHPPTGTQMYLVFQGMAVLPFAAGVVLGVPLIAPEVERGTALLAWPLARSRRRWLAVRLLPVAVVGLALLAIPAVAAEVLERSLHPLTNPGASFEQYGVRGLLPMLRFVPVLVVSAMVGAALGRQLPALLVAGAVAAGIGIGLEQVKPLWLEPVEQRPFNPYGEFSTVEWLGDLYVRTRYRDVDGSWMSEEDALAAMTWMEGDEPEPDWTQMPREVPFRIPGERYPDVMLRESGALLGGAALIGGLLVLVVERRRPG